ncbi:MAG: hypothetical protein O3A01_07450 [bacterium]|nr:hypothetical protein [bacterium]
MTQIMVVFQVAPCQLVMELMLVLVMLVVSPRLLTMSVLEQVL